MQNNFFNFCISIDVFKKQFDFIIINLCVWVFAYKYCWVSHMCLIQKEAKRGDTLELELQTLVELPCACWETSPDPAEEQSGLVTAEPSL